MELLFVLALSCAASCGLSLALTPLARSLARRAGILDRPGGRKTHTAATPLLGGLSILLATTASTAAALWVIGMPEGSGIWLAAGTGGVLILSVGIWDDARSMRARHKLLLQILVAGGVVGAGLRIDTIALPGIEVPLRGASVPMTILWIVAVTNAWNLLDGLDGLAAGVGGISAGFLGLWMLGSGEPATAVLLFALAGACAGFLRYNFPRASIFMGDGGSLFIGYALSVAPLLVERGQRGGAALSAALPLLFYLVPVGDMAASVVRRTLLFIGIRRLWRLPLGQLLQFVGGPDRGHLHHALLRRSLDARRTTRTLWAISALLGGAALLHGGIATGWAILLLAPAGMALLLHRLGCVTPGSPQTSRKQERERIVAPAGQVPEARLSNRGRRAA